MAARVKHGSGQPWRNSSSSGPVCNHSKPTTASACTFATSTISLQQHLEKTIAWLMIFCLGAGIFTTSTHVRAASPAEAIGAGAGGGMVPTAAVLAVVAIAGWVLLAAFGRSSSNTSSTSNTSKVGKVGRVSSQATITTDTRLLSSSALYPHATASASSWTAAAAMTTSAYTSTTASAATVFSAAQPSYQPSSAHPPTQLQYEKLHRSTTPAAARRRGGNHSNNNNNGNNNGNGNGKRNSNGNSKRSSNQAPTTPHAANKDCTDTHTTWDSPPPSVLPVYTPAPHENTEERGGSRVLASDYSVPWPTLTEALNDGCNNNTVVAADAGWGDLATASAGIDWECVRKASREARRQRTESGNVYTCSFSEA